MSENTPQHLKKKKSGRHGPSLSPLERTMAAIRVDKGETVEAIARELRVFESTVRLWMNDWPNRTGPWRHWRDELLDVEVAAGYELADGRLRRAAQPANAAAIAAARKRTAEAQREVVEANREMFVAQLEATVKLASSPAFETEARAYRALDDEARELVTPAWDLYLIAVEELRTKGALAIRMARRELGLEVVEEDAAAEMVH